MHRDLKTLQMSLNGKLHLINMQADTLTTYLTLCGRKVRFKSAPAPGATNKEFDGGVKCCIYCARQYRSEWLRA